MGVTQYLLWLKQEFPTKEQLTENPDLKPAPKIVIRAPDVEYVGAGVSFNVDVEDKSRTLDQDTKSRKNAVPAFPFHIKSKAYT